MSFNSSIITNITRNLEKQNPCYEEKKQELRRNGGVEASTSMFVPLVTDRDRFPQAPRFLPAYMLIGNKKIIVQKKQLNVVKFKDGGEPIATLVLVEPWREAQEFDKLIGDQEVLTKAQLRLKQMIPTCSCDYPDLA